MSAMQKLEEQAHKLELHEATTHLLALFFPGIEKTPGRYTFLESAIDQRPRLLQALLSRDDGQARNEWAQVLKDYKGDVRFLHALAILYWETALGNQGTERDWIVSTILFVLLLSTEDFWSYFSEERWTNKQGERLPLETKHQEELTHDTLGGILALHSSHGKQDYVARRYEQAKIHLRCLDLCQSHEQSFMAALLPFGIHLNLSIDLPRLDWLTKQAKKLLDEWCVSLVAEAEKATKDAEAIKKLPQGIRQNYEGGVKLLEPFISLHIPVVRVLCTSLELYNDWCHDYYVLRDMERIEEVMKSARKVADQLIPLCTKGQELKRENQLLSQHFLLRGFVEEKPDEAIKEYREALAWNPSNKNAEELMHQEAIQKYMERAMELVGKGQFAQAYQVLDAAERIAPGEKEGVQTVRAAVHFRHGMQLAEDGKYREALVQARKAYQLDPTEPAIQSLIKDLEDMAPEEDNIRQIEAAEQALEKDQHDQAIRLASRIPRSSKVYQRACGIQGVAYFKRGMDAATADRFDQAEADLRKALELNTDDEIRTIISHQLSSILNTHAVTIVNGLERTLYSETQASRLAKVRTAKKLLEEALRFDRNNTSAKSNLAMVSQIV